MHQIETRQTDFLGRRKFIGPVPQIRGLEYVERTPTDDDDRLYVITAGEPTWAGQDLEKSEAQMNDETASSFLSERQHEEPEEPGNLFDDRRWVYKTEAEVPQKWLRVCRAWDLATSEAASADWTVGALMGMDLNSAIWILDVVRVQVEVAQVHDELQHFCCL